MRRLTTAVLIAVALGVAAYMATPTITSHRTTTISKASISHLLPPVRRSVVSSVPSPYKPSQTLIQQFAEPPPSPPSKLNSIINIFTHAAASPPPPTTSTTTPTEPLAKKQCEQLQQRHGVVIGSSWGSLPNDCQSLWNRLRCDDALRGKTSSLPSAPTAQIEECVRPEPTTPPTADAAPTPFELDYNTKLAAALAHRRITPSRRLRRNSSNLVIAVCACTTSRMMSNLQRLEQLTLFNIMLPSLVATLSQGPSTDASTAEGGTGQPFELWVYIAFDAGDRFYDNERQEAIIKDWLDEKVSRPLKAGPGIVARHCLLRYENGMRKPGPAFNFMMASAAEDGADYLYRINDDTQFVTPQWLPAAIKTLRSYKPPNVGVVGPTCHEGNTRILTHDLVHRTHLSIFEHYYPPVLSDWWMDDWITRVYSQSGRMTRMSHVVKHRVDVHGTRYQIDYSHERALVGQLASGWSRLDRFLREQ